MIDSWLSGGGEGSRSILEDLRTLVLHVLAYVGFQKSYPFKSVAKSTELQEPLTYRDSLAVVLKNVLVILVLPPFAFRIPFMPAKWKQIGLAVTAFRKYMLDELREEKRLIAEGQPGSGTLMSNLVRSSESLLKVVRDEKERNVKDGKESLMKPLSVDEITGNTFVFNFAGHDTAAISLAFSVLLLIAHPET